MILSCKDTRLTDLLPKSLYLENRGAKIIKNAGAMISHPFGSIIRSILVVIYEFEVDEVLVSGHHNCGMCNLNNKDIVNKIMDKAVKKKLLIL